MVGSENEFDPKLLQARWLLGSVGPEELTNQAGIALLHGFDGTALRQLAGLIRPTTFDLGALPERAFAEMRLEALAKDQAIDFLVAHGIPKLSGTISMLVAAFPSFTKRWREHVAYWRGEPAGDYNDMAEFVNFVVEDLYEKGNLDETRRVFECLEKLFAEGNQKTRDLIGWGFFETLQNVASWRPYGNTVFEQFFGPMSMQVWKEIRRKWAGKSSLMDVIRSEKNTPQE
jgi:hypothetical protein